MDGYCSHKDKEILTKSEARVRAGKMGMTAYECKECGGWHTGHRLKQQNRTRLRKQGRY